MYKVPLTLLRGGGMNKLNNFAVTDSSKLELSIFFLGNGVL